MAKLSLAKLERPLYSAADRLRQEGFDATTCKDYIFGLLFLKRCSDVFEAERIVGRKVKQGMFKKVAESLAMANPPRPEQDATSEILLNLEDLLFKTEAELRKQKMLKAGLMAEFLTGRIHVPESISVMEHQS